MFQTFDLLHIRLHSDYFFKHTIILNCKNFTEPSVYLLIVIFVFCAVEFSAVSGMRHGYQVSFTNHAIMSYL